MNRIAKTFALAVLALAATGSAFAQQPPSPPGVPQAAPVPAAPAVPVYPATVDARETQQQLRELLDQHPPSLREVLQADPTLAQRADYLAPYPVLAAFLQAHPEVSRNPQFFFGERYYEPAQTDRQRALREIGNILGGVAFLTGFLTVVTLIFFLLRHALDYRRWRRQIQIQTEMHNKVFDRLTTNQELMAYIESPAARRLMEAGPVAAAESASISAPITRILWAVQIGVVVAAVGAGFWVARGTVTEAEIANAFEVMGTLAMAVGIGFVLSAVVSWLLSQRLGLLRSVRSEQ